MFGFKKKFKVQEPKSVKLYRIIYETSVIQTRHEAIVSGTDEFQAIDNFRKLGASQKYSDVVNIKLYNVEGNAE